MPNISLQNVSVVVINYNKLGYLQKVSNRIREIAKDIELILSDDHSNDGSCNWARKSGLFDHVFRKTDRTPYCLSEVRNEGVRLATRDYVVLLDGDCLPEVEYFSSMLRLLNSHEEKVIAVGFTDHYDKDGKQMLLEDPRKSYLSNKGVCNIGWRDAFGGNICFPVSVWKQIDGFDQDFDGYWGYEDLEFAIRCCKVGIKLFGVRGMNVRHLQHPLSASIEQSNLKGRNFRLINSKHPGLL